MLAKLFGSKATIGPLELDLLDSIRPGTIPDPTVLREHLSTLNKAIAETAAEWSRLAGCPDAEAFLARPLVAERLRALREEAARLPQQIEIAERRRTAFLALVRLFESVAATVAAQMQALLFEPPQDTGERAKLLTALDQSTRTHVRLAPRLAAISTSGQFRDPPDALKMLRQDLERRIQELDRKRTPGMRAPFVMPAQMSELLDAMEGGMSRKETA